MNLHEVFASSREENRAALIGYLPAGYPTVERSKDLLSAMLAGTDEGPGCDIVEVGLPFSDPVIDGPTIQVASGKALKAGFRVRDLFDVVSSVASRGGHAVVMTYWNPVHKYGPDAFARDLKAAGGLGVITPDLVPDEAEDWMAASEAHGLDRIFLVAPASTDERIAMTVKASSGFVYAASVMGVTGARDSVGAQASGLVERARAHTDLPIGVGLGVRSGAQAAEVAAFADGVIVGSAFISRAEEEGAGGVSALAAELGRGVRQR